MRMVKVSSSLISQTHLSSDSVAILLSGWRSTWKPANVKNVSRAPFVLSKHDFLVLLTYFSEPSYLLGRMEADLISKCKVTMGNYDSMIKATASWCHVEMWGTNWPFVILHEWKLSATELVEFPINNAPVYLYDLCLTPLPACWELVILLSFNFLEKPSSQLERTAALTFVNEHTALFHWSFLPELPPRDIHIQFSGQKSFLWQWTICSYILDKPS